MSTVGLNKNSLSETRPSFWDIEIWYWTNTVRRKKTFEAFERFQEILWEGQDAIWWLYEKYYTEDLSLEQILNLPIFRNFNFVSKATLHRVLFSEDTLWWKPKESTQKTVTHDKNKMLNIASVRDKVEEIISAKKTPVQPINIWEYNNLRYPLKRLFYILEKLGGITEWAIEEIFDKNEISSEILIQILNEKAKAFVSLSWLALQDFTPKTGSVLRNYFMRKLEKQVA